MRDIQKILGENIKYYRRMKNLQQVQLSEDIGIGQATLSRIEAGKIDSGISSIQKIAEGLEMSVSQLLTDMKGANVSIFEKVTQIESLNDYDQKILEGVMDGFLEKHRLEGIQDLKLKKRLQELEKVRHK